MKIKVGPRDRVHDIVSQLEASFGKTFIENPRHSDCLVIIDEFYANLKAYVAPTNPQFCWLLDTDIGCEGISIGVEYPGPCFDPTQVSEIAEQSIKVRPIGGLGLGLISALSDTLDYQYEKGWNVIRIHLSDILNSEDMH